MCQEYFCLNSILHTASPYTACVCVAKLFTRLCSAWFCWSHLVSPCTFCICGCFSGAVFALCSAHTCSQLLISTPAAPSLAPSAQFQTAFRQPSSGFSFLNVFLVFFHGLVQIVATFSAPCFCKFTSRCLTKLPFWFHSCDSKRKVACRMTSPGASL